MKSLMRFAAVIAFALASTLSIAQGSWPSRPVRLVTPAPPGVGPDIFARLYAEPLAKALGVAVSVDNRPGASGNIGVDAVAKAPADGYTVLYGYNSLFTMNPHLFAKLPFDATKDLVAVTQNINGAYFVVSNNDFAGRSIREIGDLARSQPGKINYATYGPGTAMHLGFELIQDLMRIRLTHVPYKQGTVNDIIAGQVQLGMEPAASIIPFIKSNRVKAVAFTGARRHPQFPDLPTVAESLPDMVLNGWHGLWVPAGTPREVIQRLNAEVARITRTPEFAKRVTDIGFETNATTSEETTAIVQRESEQWGRVIKSKGISLE